MNFVGSALRTITLQAGESVRSADPTRMAYGYLAVGGSPGFIKNILHLKLQSTI